MKSQFPLGCSDAMQPKGATYAASVRISCSLAPLSGCHKQMQWLRSAEIRTWSRILCSCNTTRHYIHLDIYIYMCIYIYICMYTYLLVLRAHSLTHRHTHMDRHTSKQANKTTLALRLQTSFTKHAYVCTDTHLYNIG